MKYRVYMYEIYTFYLEIEASSRTIARHIAEERNYFSAERKDVKFFEFQINSIEEVKS